MPDGDDDENQVCFEYFYAVYWWNGTEWEFAGFLSQIECYPAPCCPGNDGTATQSYCCSHPELMCCD